MYIVYATCEWPEFYAKKKICSVLFCSILFLKYIVLSLEKSGVNKAVCSFSLGSTCLSNDPFKFDLDEMVLFVLLFKSSL